MVIQNASLQHILYVCDPCFEEKCLIHALVKNALLKKNTLTLLSRIKTILMKGNNNSED